MRYVPEDEAQEVRELLEENDIAYFETHAGYWGISVPAIWAKREDQFDRARELIEKYQDKEPNTFEKSLKLGNSEGKLRQFGTVSWKTPFTSLFTLG
ncbi:MAG: hypothetical protein CM1200mP40_15350 [Gammaproteobacteria bacterium]|nr:MAG: hypothetical protein CM1200mP40_15350 [Gammaproteobacteria bacterium]